MRIAIGADHAGLPVNQRVIDELSRLGHEAIDVGAPYRSSADDYPDFAAVVGRAVAAGDCERGILVCGSGVGVSVAANKVRGVRAAVCHDVYSAHQGVEHDDLNVLCVGTRVIGPELMMEIIRAFVAARFTGEERHQRRLAKVKAMEDGFSRS